MADKRLIAVPLDGLRTNDEEVIGSLYPHKGKIYRWVKNAGSTALQAAGACLTLPTASIDQTYKRVVAPTGAGPSTAASGSFLDAGGVPVAAIGPSGSDTGEYGWIQVKGPKKVSMLQSATAADQYVGSISIPYDSDANWNRPISPVGTPTTLIAEAIAVKRLTLARVWSTTGPTTAYSALVDIQCL